MSDMDKQERHIATVTFTLPGSAQEADETLVGSVVPAMADAGAEDIAVAAFGRVPDESESAGGTE